MDKRTLVTVGIVGAGAVALLLFSKRREERKYSAGGSGWGEFEKGKKVDFDYVRAGQLLLEDNEQFRAKNVFKVTEVTSQGIKGHFVNPDNPKEKRMSDDREIFHWAHELENGEFFWPKGKYIVKASEYSAPPSELAIDLMPGVTALIKAKKDDDKPGIKKADAKIYTALNKHGYNYKKGIIPYGLTTLEKEDPMVLAKRISCIAKVMEKGGTKSPFGICRASVKEAFSADDEEVVIVKDGDYEVKRGESDDEGSLIYLYHKGKKVADGDYDRYGQVFFINVGDKRNFNEAKDIIEHAKTVKFSAGSHKGKHPVDDVKPGVGTLHPANDADLTKPLTDAEMKRLGQEFMEQMDNNEDKPAKEKWDVLKYWDGYLDALVDANTIKYTDRVKIYDLHHKHPKFKGTYFEIYPEMKDRFKAPGDKKLYIKSFVWESREDSYEEGDLESANLWDQNVNESFDSIEEVIEYMDKNWSVPKDAWNIDEDYGMEASFLVDVDNLPATESDRDAWKKGNKRLWSAYVRLQIKVFTEHEFNPEEWKESLGKYQEKLVVRAPKIRVENNK